VANPPDDEFFVGYNPTPPGLLRFVRAAAAVAFAAALAAGLAAAAMRPPAGDGPWDDAPPSAGFEGTAVADPHPLLFGDDGRTALLVAEGKFGARERIAPFAGKRVRIAGTLIHRDGRRMIEISDAPDAVAEIAGGAARIPEPVPLGPATVSGEIVDPKCHLGAMRPGRGATHRACAVLCLRGGIPPMLATDDGGYLLLVGPDGSALGDAVLPLVGGPVTASGLRERRGDLELLRVAVADIRRR
jgi:hypothetical protein